LVRRFARITGTHLSRGCFCHCAPFRSSVVWIYGIVVEGLTSEQLQNVRIATVKSVAIIAQIRGVGKTRVVSKSTPRPQNLPKESRRRASFVLVACPQRQPTNRTLIEARRRRSQRG